MLLLGASGVLQGREAGAQARGAAGGRDSVGESAGEFAAVRAAVVRLAAADSVPSVAVAVVRDGRVVWADAVGFADTARRVRATPETPYYLASVTKTLTATAVVTLAERGRLRLDAPANTYLAPSARLWSAGPWSASRATVRHLLQHTSGITTFWNVCYPDQAGCRVQPMDSAIRKFGALMFPPGEHFDYTNLGYGILGEVAARAAGASFAEVLRDAVFRPAGMRHASLGPAPDRSAAVRHSRTRGAHDVATTATPGASGGYASAADLARFALLHLGGGAGSVRLTPATLSAMHDTTVPTGDGDGAYALGWWVEPSHHGYRALFAQGGTDDASASLLVLPEARVAVAVLANTGTGITSAITEAALDAVVPGYRERRTQDSVRVAQSTAKSPDASSVAPPVPAALQGHWVGAIRTPHGEVPVRVHVSATRQVEVALGDAQALPLQRAALGPFAGTGGRVAGRVRGDLHEAADVGPGPYDVYLELYRRGATLLGLATTYPTSDARFGARLSYPVALTPAQAAERD